MVREILTVHWNNPETKFLLQSLLFTYIKTGYSIQNITKQFNRPQSDPFFFFFKNKSLGLVSARSVPPVPEKKFPHDGVSNA